MKTYNIIATLFLALVVTTATQAVGATDPSTTTTTHQNKPNNLRVLSSSNPQDPRNLLKKRKQRNPQDPDKVKKRKYRNKQNLDEYNATYHPSFTIDDTTLWQHDGHDPDLAHPVTMVSIL